MLLFAMGLSAYAQSVPVATASPLYTPFSLPRLNGTLQYSVSGNVHETFGYEGGVQNGASGNINGNLGFIAPSVIYPSSIFYSGGYSINQVGSSNQFYQNLSVTQGYNTARWKFNFSDSVSYLPETASTGLSGIPGSGDLGIITGTDASQQILTGNSARVSNSVSGSVSRGLTGKTSLSGSASYSIQRFINEPQALESNGLGANGNLTHRIDARSSFSTGYHVNQFTYIGQAGNFDSQGGTLTYSRNVTRAFSISLSGGPEYVGGGGSGLSARPSMLTYSADLNASYLGGPRTASSLSASYVRSSNNGSGTSIGAETDTFSLSGTRRITRSLQPSVQVSYTRTVGFSYGGIPGIDTNTFVASTQANRAISRVTSVYVSYTAQHQNYSGGFQGIAPIVGLSQTLAFGVTYSPAGVHLGRQ